MSYRDKTVHNDMTRIHIEQKLNTMICNKFRLKQRLNTTRWHEFWYKKDEIPQWHDRFLKTKEEKKKTE